MTIENEVLERTIGMMAEGIDAFQSASKEFRDGISNKLSNYRSVSKNFFMDKKVRGLSQTEKLVFLFILIDGRYTQDFGICFASLEDIASSLGISPEEVLQAILHLQDLNMLRYDEENDEILIVHFYKYNWQKNNERFGKGLIKRTGIIQNPNFRSYVNKMIHEVMIDKDSNEEQS